LNLNSQDNSPKGLAKAELNRSIELSESDFKDGRFKINKELLSEYQQWSLKLSDKA
jgi:hypothetical protein